MTSPADGRPTVIVADDDSVALVGLRTFLGRDFDVVGEVRRLADLLDEVDRLKPETVVVDLSFRREGDALDVIRIGRDSGRFHCPFVVHSGHDAPAQIRAAFDAGASGFVGKGEDLGRLSDAVAAAIRGERVLPEWMKERSGTVYKGGRKVRSDRAIIDGIPLTVTEIEVLLAVYEGKSNAQIGRYLGMKASAVGFHITMLRRKIGIHEKALLVRWAADRHAPLSEAIRRH